MPSPTLIPRSVLLSQSARSAPVISPDGDQIAWVAPHDGARNIWLAASNDKTTARAVTTETTSRIREIWWSAAPSVLIVLMDATGSEQTDLFAFDLAVHAWRRLSPLPDGQNRLLAISANHPDHILLETNSDNPEYFDAWRVDVHTGAAERTLRNDRFSWLHADQELRVRLGEQRHDDGSVSFHAIDPDGGSRLFTHVSSEDEATTRPLRVYELLNAFGPGDAEIYAMDSRGRDTSALAAWNLSTGAVRMIGGDDRADLAAVATDAATKEVLAWASEYDRPRIHAMPAAQSALDAIRAKLGDDVWIGAQSTDAQRWIVSSYAPDRTTRHYLFNRTDLALAHLYDERPELTAVRLAPMTTHIVRSRDGLDLVCYVARPFHAPPGPLPTVVLIHGGPWIRDAFAFDPWIQFVASRGYAVLTVNFRGSRGFGKTFLNAGDREWGGAMLDDVLDAVQWAIDEKIALPGKIAAMGASFGGYSVLSAMARTPELFACGVDIFGLSNLESFLESIPPHWKVLKAMWRRRVGDIDTEEGRAFLRRRSPLHDVDKMIRPILIAHGATDPRVLEGESRQMALALDARRIETTYVLFPNEGHNFFQLANELSFFACVEGFLAKHLGGRAEPFGTEIEQSDITVPLGARHIPGLEDALQRRSVPGR